MTLPMLVDMSRRDRLSATTITVSHLDLLPLPRLVVDARLRGESSASVSDEFSPAGDWRSECFRLTSEITKPSTLIFVCFWGREVWEEDCGVTLV